MLRAEKKGEPLHSWDLGYALTLICLAFGWSQDTYLGYLGSRPEYIAARCEKLLAKQEKEDEQVSAGAVPD